jgi:hypothetical protein
MTEGTRLPYPIDLDRDDIDVRDLIKSWRYHGAPLGWDAIVGHEPQVRRCREIVEVLAGLVRQERLVSPSWPRSHYQPAVTHELRAAP